MRIITIDSSTTRSALFAESIIKEGENLATKIVFVIPNDMLGYSYQFLFQLNEQLPVITGYLVEVDGKVEYVLTNALTSTDGQLKLEIQAFGADNALIKTATFSFRVQKSIEGDAVVIPESYVPWYTVVLQQTELATTKAQEASISAENALVSEQNTDTSEANALLYSQNAHTSEVNAKTSEDNAKNSELLADADQKSVAQIMQDYLAMLGTDVATLDANGKLNISQLPPLAINDTYPVTSTDEMITLTVQKGDVALIIANDVVTDSYILAGDDPSLLSNWKKLGISYVAESGHATNSDTAIDSQKINGHRVVVFDTQDEYNSAVKDSETVYLVKGV